MMTQTHTYTRIAAALLPAAFVVCAGAAQACVLEPANCGLPGGGTAYFNGSNGSVVTFTEVGGDVQRHVVAECGSRSSLAIIDPERSDRDQAYWDAADLIEAAVHDDAETSLRALRRQIQRMGIETELFTLAGNHCGCDLPNIAPPPSNCPVDF
jgi:hypothetical protein